MRAVLNQLDLFTAGADLLADLFQQAREQTPPARLLFNTKAGHHAANLTMFGIRGFQLALCTEPLEPLYRPSYLESST